MINRKPQRYVSKRERGEWFLDVLEFAEYASAIGGDWVRFLRQAL
jgi:hypothetical protein